jgi:hypothetical protein
MNQCNNIQSWTEKNRSLDEENRIDIDVTSLYARNVFFQLKRHISFSAARARHDGKFVTRLTSAIRIVWFTELDDKNIAFFFLSNSSSYMRRNSSKKIWAESEAIDRDVWRSRLADA